MVTSSLGSRYPASVPSPNGGEQRILDRPPERALGFGERRQDHLYPHDGTTFRNLDRLSPHPCRDLFPPELHRWPVSYSPVNGIRSLNPLPVPAKDSQGTTAPEWRRGPSGRDPPRAGGR